MFLSFPRGCTSSNFTSSSSAADRPAFAFFRPLPPSNINISVSAGVNVDYKRKRAAGLGDEGATERAGAEKEHTLIERPPGVAANIWRKMRISLGASDDGTEERRKAAPARKRRRGAKDQHSALHRRLRRFTASRHYYFICVNGQFSPARNVPPPHTQEGTTSRKSRATAEMFSGFTFFSLPKLLSVVDNFGDFRRAKHQ